MEYKFKKVSDVRVGDTVVVETDGGEIERYKVRKIEKGWLSAPSVFLRFDNQQWICEPLSAEIAVE